ncbi:hypothetical protein ACOMHN_014920 [Nucella lapillus]
MCAPEAILEMCAPEAILEMYAPEAILEVCAPEAILEMCAPEAILEICAPEAILEMCAPEAILEMCAPEAILEMCAPEAILEMCAPAAILEICAPDAILEVCAPEAILEMCAPEAILEMCDPEAILEVCAPEAILEICAQRPFLRGSSTLTLVNADQAVATATGDIPTGDYEFKLTVTDEEDQSSSDKLTAHVKMTKNRPPEAKAGGDRVVLLPVSMVTLDGSASSDDRGIATYLWERDMDSLAAGDVVNHSDHQAVLQLVNLVAGRYIFMLTVTDQDGLPSHDTAYLVVKNGVNYKDLVEMVLDTDIHHFSQDHKTNIVKQLELLIHQSSQHSGTVVEVQSTQLELTQGQLRVTFFVRSKKDSSTVSGVEIVRLLTDKLDDDLILSYPIIYLDTVLCQNNCSGHGQCDQRSKTCHCEAFWMPNIFKASHRHSSNCEWSILYVVIVCFIIMVSAIAGVWGVICCCRSKRCRIKTRKRHRYSLLREIEDEDDKNKLELMPKNKIQNSSVMISESDFSSEEETLFVNSKPVNGHSKPPNGVVPRQQFRTKLKA